MDALEEERQHGIVSRMISLLSYAREQVRGTPEPYSLVHRVMVASRAVEHARDDHIRELTTYERGQRGRVLIDAWGDALRVAFDHELYSALEAERHVFEPLNHATADTMPAPKPRRSRRKKVSP